MRILSTYEKLIPSKRIPYWIFWPALGLSIFTVGWIMETTLTNKRYFWTLFFASAAISFLPIVYISFSHRFQRTMQAIHMTFWADETDFQDWLQNRLQSIFTLKTWQSKIVTSLITFPGIITVLMLGIPSRRIMLQALGLVLLTVILIICGQGLFVCMHLLATLREIVWRPAKVPFFKMANRVIARLQNYYSFVAVIVTFAYICLAIAIWRGPYGLPVAMQIWLSVLAFYPLSIFLWSYFQLHVLMKNIKYYHLDTINREVQVSLERVFYTYSFEDVQRLDKVMEIQTKVQSMKEWPFASQGAVAFLITFLTAAAQLFIAILKVNKP